MCHVASVLFLFLVVRGSASDLREDVRLAQDQKVLAIDRDVGAAVLAVEDLVALFDVERDALTVLDLPSPTASTLPFCGFSLAVSGSTIPLAVVSSSSTGFTITRSPRGFSFIGKPPHNSALAAGDSWPHPGSYATTFWHSSSPSANSRAEKPIAAGVSGAGGLAS